MTHRGAHGSDAIDSWYSVTNHVQCLGGVNFVVRALRAGIPLPYWENRHITDARLAGRSLTGGAAAQAPHITGSLIEKYVISILCFTCEIPTYGHSIQQYDLGRVCRELKLESGPWKSCRSAIFSERAQCHHCGSWAEARRRNIGDAVKEHPSAVEGHPGHTGHTPVMRQPR